MSQWNESFTTFEDLSKNQALLFVIMKCDRIIIDCYHLLRNVKRSSIQREYWDLFARWFINQISSLYLLFDRANRQIHPVSRQRLPLHEGEFLKWYDGACMVVMALTAGWLQLPSWTDPDRCWTTFYLKSYVLKIDGSGVSGDRA
jgi:hypothetical protein